MTVSEPVLDSSNSHSNDIVSKHSVADANACSRTNIVLTTAPPLYELVWSEQKGLSHISSSNSADKKASLLCTETCNIVVSPSNCNFGGNTSDGGDLERELSSLQSESHREVNDYKVTLVHSPGNACGNSGDMGEFKQKDDKLSEEKLKADKNHSEKVLYYPPPINEFQLCDAKPKTFFIQEFNSVAGPENCPARTEASRRKEQMSSIEVGDASKHRTTLECSKEFTGKRAILSSCQEPALARDVLAANVSSASTSRATNGLPLMNVEGRMEFKKGKSHNRNWSGMFSSTCNYNIKASEMNKGKEPIIHDIDDGRSSSNRRDNGQESFECISSRGIVSTVKRARIDDSKSQMIVGGKRLKRQSDANWSFMNWVTTLTTGLPRHSKDVPVELLQHPSVHMKGIISPLPISDKERDVFGVSHGIVGFQSIFQSMYQPRYNVRSNKNKYVDHQKELVTVEGTEREKQDFIYSPDSCAALMIQNRCIIPKSLWIARFSHTVSSASPKSVSHTNNPDCKLQLTQSSKYCKETEPLSSSFAKRLDALMNTTSPKNVEENTRANKFCLFCGRSDHSIRECSEVVETRLEHYLNSMPLYDRIKKATCFCILCFRLDHWAASCPNVSSKGNGFDDVNSRNTIEKHQNHHFANHDGAVMLFSSSKKDNHQVENRDLDSDFVVSTKVSLHKNESACCGILDLHMDQVEDATNMDKMKMAASFSSQNEVKRSGVTPFCSDLLTKITSETDGIFVFIRKLWLSRTDIIRWMKSSTPRINLTGFFLRLRIEKPEKGLGGTGYFVACISDESRQNSIFVWVGSSNYTVSSRFISNQDFNEDELNTWWFQKLRDGSKIPSREELNEKLQLRKKFGF